VDADVTETPTHYNLKGVFIDLQTGFTYTRLFRQRKSQKLSARMDGDRQEDIVDLRGMATALKEGRVSAAEIFPAREPAPATGEPPAPSAEAAASEATSVEPGKPPPVAKPGKSGPQAAQSDPLPGQALPAGEEPLQELTKPCPDWEGKPKPVSFCNKLCPNREDCPEWD